MKKYKKIFLTLSLLTTLQAEVEIDSVGFNFGVGNISYEQKDTKGEVKLAKELDESYTQIEIYTLLKGAFDDTTIKPTINYVYSKNDDFTNNMLLIGVNKFFPLEEFNFYAGILAGYGILDWRYNPVTNAKDIDTKTSSFVGAVQAGVEYEVDTDIFVTLNSKYSLSNYKSYVEPSNRASSTITHENGGSISVGLRYRF